LLEPAVVGVDVVDVKIGRSWLWAAGLGRT
jgi:hypothetical protein